MIVLPNWFTSGVIGFGVSMIVGWILRRPLDQEALLNTVLMAMGAGLGIALSMVLLFPSTASA